MSNHSNNSKNSDGTLLEQDLPEKIAEPTPETEAAPTGTTPRTKVMMAAAAALILAAAGAWFAHNAWLHEDTDDAQVDGHIMPLSARVNGHVQQVNVIEGQMVHAGDVLVVIDASDYNVAAAQARANLADAEATATGTKWSVPISTATAWSDLDSAQAGVRNADAGVGAAGQELESAKAELAAAEANAQKTDADLSRYAQLVARQDVSRQQYDQAVAAAKANRAAVASADAVVRADQQIMQEAQGKLLQAKATLQSSQTAPEQVSLAHAKYDSANAQVERRKAELEQAELNLSYTIIRSPVNGIVGKKSVEIGQNVGVGQELVDVVPLDDVWITANFKETQLRHMRPGDAVEIKVDAYGRTWKGHVTNLGGGTGSVFSLLPPENATGNYVKVVQRVPVRIDFDRSQGGDFNAEGLLKPGLSVDPEVTVR
jgi:membrane fusion protein (multidrug efflux system)